MCKSQPKYPAHRFFVNKFIDWDKVQRRLNQYPSISKWFPIEYLQRCSEKGPYYCHYLSWRLGTWSDENLFVFFDLLFKECENIPGWKKNSLLRTCVYDEFWSILWEMQVAVMFSNHLNMNVKWLDSGPDLYVHGESGKFFVECYVYRKSFGLEEFIQEIFFQICPDIIVDHVPATKFDLPKGIEIEAFLDHLFKPFLDESCMVEKIKRANNNIKNVKRNNLFIYHKDFRKEILGDIRDFQLSTMGDPDGENGYLTDAITKIIDNKKDSNNLSKNHPNLLMANLIIDKDWQISRMLRDVPTPDLGESVDGIVLAACGINKIPTWVDSIYLRDNHPVSRITIKEGEGYKFIN